MTVPHARGRRRVLVIVFLTASLSLLDGRQASAREGLALDRVLAAARSGSRYQAATLDELARCEELFVRTFRDPRPPELAAAWNEIGFRLEQLTDVGPQTWVVVETPRRKRGWGCYVLCADRFPGMILQAPHSYSDRYTDNVALRLFADGTFAAAAWNTVPRKIVDVAHTTDHPFTAFTRALVRVHPASMVVQVHGFSQDKRRTIAGSHADLIISNGTRAPDRPIRQLAIRLQEEFSYGVVQLFPAEVQELGATSNVQGEILRQAGSTRFVHLEMSQDLRLRIVNDPQARHKLLKSLGDFAD